jgi:hypothetical protein
VKPKKHGFHGFGEVKPEQNWEKTCFFGDDVRLDMAFFLRGLIGNSMKLGLRIS